jgi:hypothetical protein
VDHQRAGAKQRTQQQQQQGEREEQQENAREQQQLVAAGGNGKEATPTSGHMAHFVQVLSVLSCFVSLVLLLLM